ncbi:MAG: hypothetical protein CMA64_00945 [Euryarchaeota archaeon]|nr:hypothetical protein [Euryarchaeota archaeon]
MATEQDIVLHPANRAAHLYKSGTSDSPRRADQFFIVFNLYPTQNDDFLQSKYSYIKDFRDRLHFLCHTVEGPKFQIQQDVMNQYNRKRIINRKIDFDPVSIRMYDTIDGLGMRFMKLLYEFEFQGARLYKESSGSEFGSSSAGNTNSEVSNYQESVLTNSGNFKNTHNFGMRAQPGNYHRLLKSIDFYQVAGRLYSKARMIHPRLSRMDMDQFDYSSSAIANISMGFQYENLVFEEVAVKIEDSQEKLDSVFKTSVNKFEDYVRPWEQPLFKDSQLPPAENKKRPPAPIDRTAILPEERPNVYDNFISNPDLGEFSGMNDGTGMGQIHAEEFAMTKSVTDKFALPTGSEYTQAQDGSNVRAHSKEFDGTTEGMGNKQIHANEYSIDSASNYSSKSSAVNTKIDEKASSESLTSADFENFKRAIIIAGPTNDSAEAKKAFKEKIEIIDQAIANKKNDETNNKSGIWT